MKIHFVKKGETLSAIAKKYGLTLEQLLAANPFIKNPDVIEAGAKLAIPHMQDGAEKAKPGASPSAAGGKKETKKISTAPVAGAAEKEKASVSEKEKTSLSEKEKASGSEKEKASAAEMEKANKPSGALQANAAVPAFPHSGESGAKANKPQSVSGQASPAAQAASPAGDNKPLSLPANMPDLKVYAEWGDITSFTKAEHPFAAYPMPAWPASAAASWPEYGWAGTAGTALNPFNTANPASNAAANPAASAAAPQPDATQGKLQEASAWTPNPAWTMGKGPAPDWSPAAAWPNDPVSAGHSANPDHWAPGFGGYGAPAGAAVSGAAGIANPQAPLWPSMPMPPDWMQQMPNVSPYAPSLNAPWNMPYSAFGAPYNTPFSINFLSQPPFPPAIGQDSGEARDAGEPAGIDGSAKAKTASAGESRQEKREKKRKESLGEKVAKLHAARKGKRQKRGG